MYEDKTYEAILQEKLARVASSLDKREGSIIFDALAPNSLESAMIYVALDTVLNETFADTASRDYLMGLKDLREARNLSRAELAKASGIRYQKIRDIEVGIIKPENITLKTAIKLAQALECDPAELMKPDREVSAE